MPELKPIGRLSNLDDLDTEPLTVPIIGYTEDKQEVETKIRFVGTLPAGASLDMIRATDANGRISNAAALDYVDNCVHAEDKEAWDELLHGTAVIVRITTVLEVYQALAEFYTKRPTKRRPASVTGRPSTGATTRVAASAKTSTRKNSH